MEKLFWVIAGIGLLALSIPLSTSAQIYRPSSINSLYEEMMGNAMSLEEWEAKRLLEDQVKQKRKILKAQEDIKDETFRGQWETSQNRAADLSKINHEVKKARGHKDEVEPDVFTGKNPDGTTYTQISGTNLYILKAILEKRGDPLAGRIVDLANGQNPNRVSWSLTWDQKDKDKFGTIFTGLRTVQLFDKDKLPYYIESDDLTPVYNSETGEVSWQKVTTITDEIIWKEGSKYYAENKSQAHRLMTGYHQITRNHDLNTNTEIWRDNVEWAKDRIVGRPWRMNGFHQKVREFGEDPETGERYEKTYELDRGGMEYEWSPGEKENEGQWLLTRYEQKLFNDSTAPELVTYSFAELTYNKKFDQLETSLIVNHRIGPNMNIIDVKIETDIIYDPKLGLYAEKSLYAEISPTTFRTVKEALDYGRNLLLVMTDKDLRQTMEDQLGTKLELDNIDHISYYDKWISLVMERVVGGRTIAEAIEEAKTVMTGISPRLVKRVEEWKGEPLDFTDEEDVEMVQEWKDMEARFGCSGIN